MKNLTIRTLPVVDKDNKLTGSSAQAGGELQLEGEEARDRRRDHRGQQPDQGQRVLVQLDSVFTARRTPTRKGRST
jgi:CBS-domain-containing membrane protein